MFRKYLLLYALCLTAIFAYPRAVNRGEAAPDVDLDALIEWEANALFEKLRARFAGPWPEFEQRPAELTALRELALEYRGRDYPQVIYLKGINFVLFYAKSTGHDRYAPPLEAEFWEHADRYPDAEAIARVRVARDVQGLKLANGTTPCRSVAQRTERLASENADHPQSTQISAQYLAGLRRAIDLKVCRGTPDVARRLWQTSLLFAYDHIAEREASKYIAEYLEQRIGEAMRNPPFDDAAAPLYVMSDLSLRAPQWLKTRHDNQLESVLQREADYLPAWAESLRRQAERLQVVANRARRQGSPQRQVDHSRSRADSLQRAADRLRREADDGERLTIQASLDSLRRAGVNPVEILERFASAELILPVPVRATWPVIR